jgi:hypothetical protein
LVARIAVPVGQDPHSPPRGPPISISGAEGRLVAEVGGTSEGIPSKKGKTTTSGRRVGHVRPLYRLKFGTGRFGGFRITRSRGLRCFRFLTHRPYDALTPGPAILNVGC